MVLIASYYGGCLYSYIKLKNYMFLKTASAQTLFHLIDKVVVKSKIKNLRELKCVTIHGWIMDYPMDGSQLLIFFINYFKR